MTSLSYPRANPYWRPTHRAVQRQPIKNSLPLVLSLPPPSTTPSRHLSNLFIPCPHLSVNSLPPPPNPIWRARAASPLPRTQSVRRALIRHQPLAQRPTLTTDKRVGVDDGRRPGQFDRCTEKSRRPGSVNFPARGFSSGRFASSRRCSIPTRPRGVTIPVRGRQDMLRKVRHY